MNKIFKYSLLSLAAGLLFAACKDNDDTGMLDPVVLTGPQTFFSTDMPDVIEVSKDKSSFVVTINRQNTEGEVTVPITATMPEGSIYKVPANVTFADGAATADIVINYNPEDLEFGDYTDISLAVGDENMTTPYGLSSCSFSVGATAWVSMGRGFYRDDLVAPLYGADMVTYEVEIEKNILEEGMYRIKNPYGADFPYNDPGDWDTSKDYYMIIDATDPDYVYFTTCETGVNWGDGDMIVSSFVQYYMDNEVSLAAVKANKPEFFGTLKNGVITITEPKTALIGFDGKYDQYYANGHGGFALALPGYKIADYSVDYEMLGRFIDIAGGLYVEGVATLGADIVSAKAALVTEDNVDEVYQAVIDGTAGVDVVSGKTFRLPFTESGAYYVMILGYDAAGVVAEEYFRVKLVNPEEAAGISWEAAYVGNYYYDILSEEDDPCIDEGLVLYIDADNENHMMIAPWVDEDHFLEFIVNEDRSITVPEQGSGLNYDGELFVTDVTSYTSGNPEYADLASKVDGNTFVLNLVYYNKNHTLIGYDEFTLTGYATAVKSEVIPMMKKIKMKMSKKQILKTMTKRDRSLHMLKRKFTPGAIK